MSLLTVPLQIGVTVILRADPPAPNVIQLAAVPVMESIDKTTDTDPVTKIGLFCCSYGKLGINFDKLCGRECSKSRPVTICSHS